MSWLRVDDGFASHPKIAKLSDSEFRVWMRLLCYCAKYRSGEVSEAAQGELRGFTAKTLQRFEEVGLIDRMNGGPPTIHHWALYAAGSPEEKVHAYLLEHPDASANEVVEQVPGQRKAVLKAVRKYRQHTPESGS